jgi:hypothetical protein
MFLFFNNFNIILLDSKPLVSLYNKLIFELETFDFYIDF